MINNGYLNGREKKQVLGEKHGSRWGSIAYL